MNNSLQYDERGKPYFEYLDNTGRVQRTYVSPVAMDPTAQLQGPGESAWHSANQWNAKEGKVENPYKWGKLITTATAAGLGAGALNAAGILGGAGGGGGSAVAGESAGGLLPGAAVPGANSAMLAGLPSITGGVSGALGEVLPATAVAGANSAMLAGAPTATASGTGVGSSGFLGSLKNVLPSSGKDILGAAGTGLAGAGAANANNRGSEFYGQYLMEMAQQQADKQHQADLIAREQEGRTGAEDAWRKLQSAGHLLQPAPMPNVSPYSAPQRTPTGAETTGANALSAEVLKRLQTGNPIPMPVQHPLTMDPSLLKPGALEKTSSWLSPVLALLGKR